MNRNILCIVALDGQSSNHVMNYNILKGFVDCGDNLYGIVINNYPKNEDATNLCAQLFHQYYCIDGRNFDYGYKFFLKSLFNNIDWIKKLMHLHQKYIENLISGKQFSHIISFSSPIHAHLITDAIIGRCSLSYAIRVQFWSDPICGSLMNYNGHIPFRRIPIYLAERKCILLCKDNVYGTYPLYLYQKKMFHNCALRMRFIDVACTEQMEYTASFSNQKNILNIGYFGAYSPEIRNLSPLVNAVEHLKENVNLLICGNGSLKGITSINNEKVSLIRGRIPYEEAHKYELESDILVSVGNLCGCQVPGKTLYYAGLNKPIIFIADGKYSEEHITYLAKFNRYILCRNNEEEIKEAILIAISEINKNKKYTVPSLMKSEYVANVLLNARTK